MRGTFYCHFVNSEDDGRITAHMTSGDPGDQFTEFILTAPFEVFGDREVPRAWHEYKVTIELVGPIPTSSEVPLPKDETHV